MQDHLQSSYDRVASSYAKEYSAELARKPFDCEVLDRFAGDLKGRGVVCELGCGPGQVARYLKDRGVDVRGIDLSPEMVNVASGLHPDIPFSKGDMLSLDVAENSFAGLVLFYSIIHIQRADVTRAFRELSRVLNPEGKLLLSFHEGQGELHRDEWFGQPVSIDFRLFEAAEMEGYLADAGFTKIETITREPYEFEYPTTRVYISASNAN